VQFAPLETYGIDREHGFLSPIPAAAVRTPAMFDAVRNIAANLPVLLNAGEFRARLLGLPESAVEPWLRSASEGALRAILIDYAMLAQAWVWGAEGTPEALPAQIARPLVAISSHIGQVPILTYATYVLDNCQFDPDGRGDDDLNAATVCRSFTGAGDERWFISVHAAIERAAGGLIDGALTACKSVREGNQGSCLVALEVIASTWRRMRRILARMAEGCSPEFFFHRLRPFLNGWANNPALPGGLVYTGVAEFSGLPQSFRGAAGSQSTSVRLTDLLLGLVHGDDPLTRYLDELDAYRPRGHRRFLADLARAADVRGFVRLSQSSTLTDAYNSCVSELGKFRAQHLGFAAGYVDRMHEVRPGNSPRRGTGGERFIEHLRDMRDASDAQLL